MIPTSIVLVVRDASAPRQGTLKGIGHQLMFGDERNARCRQGLAITFVATDEDQEVKLSFGFAICCLQLCCFHHQPSASMSLLFLSGWQGNEALSVGFPLLVRS